MRALAITGIETASTIPATMSGSLIRATPPCARMSAGTRSSAMTATAPASSAIFACSGVTTSMITPPLSISAMPRLTRAVPVVGVGSGDATARSSREGSGRCRSYVRGPRTGGEPRHGELGVQRRRRGAGEVEPADEAARAQRQRVADGVVVDDAAERGELLGVGQLVAHRGGQRAPVEPRQRRPERVL